MKKILFSLLIFQIAFYSCEKSDKVSIPDEFLEFVELFEFEASLRGITIDIEREGLIMEFADLSERDADGLCIRKTPIEIQIDINGWKRSDHSRKEFVVFHELAHGFLNRDHYNEVLPNGHWKSMMRGAPVKITGRSLEYEKNRNYYLDELFLYNVNTPAWAIATSANVKKLDYSLAIINSETTNNIFLSNIGILPIEIIAEIGEEMKDYYVVQPTSAIINPKDSAKFEIKYITSKLGEQHGVLNFKLKSTGEIINSVELSGIGITNSPNYKLVYDFDSSKSFWQSFSNSEYLYLIGYPPAPVFCYNPKNKTWREIPTQQFNNPQLLNFEDKTMLIDIKRDEDYIQTGIKIYEFDFGTEKFVDKSTFTISNQYFYNLSSFTLANKCYLIYLDEVYEYSIDSDIWQKKSKIPENIMDIFWAVINNRVFALTNLGLFEYFPTTDSWTSIDKVHQFYRYMPPFTYKNILYLTEITVDKDGNSLFKLWQYDGKLWSIHSNLPLPFSFNTFEFGGNLYFVNCNDGSNNTTYYQAEKIWYSVWQFIP